MLSRPAQEAMTLVGPHIVAEDSPAKHVATMPQRVTMTPSHSAPPTRTNTMLLGTCGVGLEHLKLQPSWYKEPLLVMHKCAGELLCFHDSDVSQLRTCARAYVMKKMDDPCAQAAHKGQRMSVAMC